MIFTMITMVFLMLVLLTIVKEYRRTGRLTLLSILSVGNTLYGALTPFLFYYFPASSEIYRNYIFDSGMLIKESGLIRVILAVTVFQLVVLYVSFSGNQNRNPIRTDTINSRHLIRAASFMGWIMVLIGAVGVVWMGLIYNGHPWGLYEISYFERSPLAGENSLQAFMLLIGIYGAGQLIVVFLLSDRTKMAVLILLGVTLHAVGMKSKFPLFWVLFLFVVVAMGRRKELLRLFLPIGFSILILSVMSILRGVSDLSELPQYIETYGDVISETAVTPWNNDLPGPASITYYVINSVEDYTVEPITEIFMLLIPKFIFERGPVLSEVYAQKMLGSQYELGLGFGWSPICDGFILAGWMGVGFVAFVFGWLARYIDDLRTKGKGRLREFSTLVGYSAAPFFLYGIRESMGGHIKQLLIITVLVWLPTFVLSQIQIGKSRTLIVRTS